MKRLFDHDPTSGLTEIFHDDPENKGFIIEAVQDVQPTIDHNRALLNENDARTPWGEWTRIASIPPVIVQDLMRRGIWDDPAALTKWLSDPDNRAFRVREGNL